MDLGWYPAMIDLRSSGGLISHDRTNKMGFKECKICFDALATNTTQLPILGNVEAPLKFEMLRLVIVNKDRDNRVMAAPQHPGRGLLLLKLLGIGRLLVSVWRVASNHFGCFGNFKARSLDDLDVVQTAEDGVLDLECAAHDKLDALFDPKGLALERLLAAGNRKVDSNGIASERFHGQGDDDAESGILRVGEVLAAAA